MCGIAGLNSAHAVEGIAEAVQGMARRLVHRGPDDRGWAAARAGNAALAHSRLSIVDLSANARQPLFNEAGNLALICNGEIYNYVELRRDLEAKGHVFKTHSDSEVILHLFEEMGERAAERLRGMFAFVVMDLESGDMVCARDAVGEKPLFYAQTSKGVAIASEISAFEALDGVNWDLDPQAVGLFLLRNFRHVPDPWTIFKSIRALPPGHWMRIRQGRVVQRQRYWTPATMVQAVSPGDLLDAFDRAVKRCAIGDVEIGALLSGGVDSTAVVESFQRQHGRRVKTYAFGIDADDEELVRARRAAALLKTDHRETYFDADRQHDLFESLLVRHGQPIVALPLTHAMMLFEMIKADGIKVVLSGSGADEVFFGYDGAGRLASLSKIADVCAGPLARGVAAWLSALIANGKVGDALRIMKMMPGHRKAALYRHEARTLWPSLFNTSPDAAVAEVCLTGAFSDGAPSRYIDEAAWAGLFLENAHAVTIAGDLPAMANGIEVRSPFLDRDLVQMGLSIPYEQKIATTGDMKGGKVILKQALQGRVPDDILFAPKRGFGYFVQEEQVLRGPWKTRLDEAFADPDDLGGLLKKNALKALKARFDRHDPGVPAILMAKLYALQRFARLCHGASA